MTEPAHNTILVVSPVCRFRRACCLGVVVELRDGEQVTAGVISPQKILELILWLSVADANAFHERLAKVTAKRGAGARLASALHISPMTAGRYIRGLAVPQDDVGQRMCEFFDWPWATVQVELQAARRARRKET